VLAIHTDDGWDMPIAEAAEFIGEYFDGGYWSGRNPPISLMFLPTNVVIDMETGILLSAPHEINQATDIMPYVIQANSD
jgi:hypothetical protein